MNNIAFSSIIELQKKISNKELQPQEVIAFFRQRLALFDEKINAAIELFKDNADDSVHGPLAGIPGLIKDNIAIQGRKVSCSSRMLADFVSPFDATVCERLKNNGATFLGRANMDEFAMGSSTETSAYHKTKNPWNVLRVPGGSSGGSAAAVAAGLVPWSLGSDTGGSVRQPAAFCGIVGLKPTYGKVSRYGLVAYGSSLDQVGIFSRTVADSAMLLSIIAGADERDSTTIRDAVPDYSAALARAMQHKKITIGVIKNAVYAPGMDDQVVSALENAIQQFEKLGCAIKTVSLPTINKGTEAYFIFSRAEAASNLARFDGVRYGYRDQAARTLSQLYAKSRGAGFGTEVKKRIMLGNYVLSAGHAGEFYANAQRVRQAITNEFVEAFKGVDILFMPTHPAPAFELGAFDRDPLQMDLQDYFTCPVSLAGLPAISVPCGFSRDVLPIGMQLIGLHNAEEVLFQVAHAYERVTEWHTKYPPAFVQ